MNDDNVEPRTKIVMLNKNFKSTSADYAVDYVYRTIRTE